MKDENQIKKEIELIQEELNGQPDNPELINELGVGYYLLGQYSNSIIQYKKALKLDPGKAKYHFNLANAYFENNQPNQAIEAFMDAIDIDPGHIPSLNNLADVYEASGNLDKAFELYEYLVRLSPDEALAHFNLGNFYLRQNQHIEAVKCFETTLEKDEKFSDAYYNIAWVLQQAKVFEKAFEYVQKGIEIDPEHSGLLDLKKELKDQVNQQEN